MAAKKKTSRTTRTARTTRTGRTASTASTARTMMVSGAAADAGHDVTGDRILALAERHLGEAYILGARAPMGNAGWDGPWDCAEFASWCVFQATGQLYGVEPRNDPMRADAYTGYWTDQSRRDNTRISVEEAARIPGACILRIPNSSRTGHIVISDGKGGTVEAHSTKKGVIRNKVTKRRWDTGILVPGISYFMNEQEVPTKPPATVFRVTRPLMRGDTIRKIQKSLKKIGYLPGSIDGIYGPQTADAVQAFQLNNGLVADGEVGPSTIAALGL